MIHVSLSILSFHTAVSNKLEITEHTKSPLQVQPNDQMIIFAEATTTNIAPIVTWRHGNTTYSEVIREDPICPVKNKIYK